MDLLNTSLGSFIWKLIVLVIFIALMKGLVTSAADSLKRSHGKWISIVDEVIEGIIGLVIFFVVIASPPSTIIGMLMKVISFVWGLIAPILRTYLGLPV